MIDITGVDLVKLVKEVYNLSAPQGMGFLHFTNDELTNEEVNEFIAKDKNEGCIISLDYVKGRACKFTVFNTKGKLEIHDNWYYHTNAQQEELFKRVMPKVKINTKQMHNPGCNCIDCRLKQGS